MIGRRWATGTTAALIAAVVSVFPASAQDIPSVGIRPVGTDTDGPNAGGWWAFEGPPGATLEGAAEIVNGADVPQEVEVSIRDLVFNDQGVPEIVEGAQTDLGAWSVVEPARFTIAASGVRTVRFTIRVPSDAEPGDHIGVLVATTANRQGSFLVRRRVATRLYVTVPGEAVRSLVVDRIEPALDSAWWPRRAAVAVWLRNDGRIRLHPTVTVSGHPADGPELILARSVEQYVAHVPVPWYGGPVRLVAEVTTAEGLVRTAATTVFVVPWGLLVVALLGAAGLWLARRWWQQRASQTAQLKAEIARLERLITQRSDAAAPLPDFADEATVLRAALGRARRAGDDVALARAALALHGTTGDALDELVEALMVHDGAHRDALIAAAATYGADALAAHPHFPELDDATRSELSARALVATAPREGNGHGAQIPELAEVRGLGPAKQAALLAAFGSVERLRRASVEELEAVRGIGPRLARDIHRALHATDRG